MSFIQTTADNLANISSWTQTRFVILREARGKEVTGLLHISDRLLVGELSRVEAARGTLQSLPIDINVAYVEIARGAIYSLPELPFQDCILTVQSCF